MKPMAVILSLAIAGIALTSDFTAASANKMNGKCCAWSDGGRSHRYIMETMIAALPPTCSAHAAWCARVSTTRPDRFQMCYVAKAQCMRSGEYVGPYSGRQFAGMQRM